MRKKCEVDQLSPFQEFNLEQLKNATSRFAAAHKEKTPNVVYRGKLIGESVANCCYNFNRISWPHSRQVSEMTR
ncbi:hypothetical protein DITRI_Ditri20bG0094900 [Diplodiscus trichospermus]